MLRDRRLIDISMDKIRRIIECKGEVLKGQEVFDDFG